MRGKRFPPGRGFLHHPGGQVLLQVAAVPLAGEDGEGGESLEGWVRALQERAAESREAAEHLD